MKRSLLAAFAILVLGAVPALVQQRQVAELKRERQGLLKQARDGGLADFGDARTGQGRVPRVRPDVGKDADRIGTELADLARELAELEAAGSSADDGLQQRAVDLMSRLAALDAAGIRRVIEGLESVEGMGEDTRRRLIGFSLLALAEDRPQTAVTLFSEAGGLLRRDSLTQQALSTAMQRWAEMDAGAAAAWLQARERDGSGWVDDEVRRALLAGIASGDPSRAFGLIDQLGFKDGESALQAVILAGTEDPAQRSLVLEALRGHLAGIPDESTRSETAAMAMELLAQNVEPEKFESVTRWIDSARLSAEEKAGFADGLTWFATRGETGRWVEWLAGNVPPDELGEPVRELVGEWTQQDYLAAGRWLAATPDGPAKAAAVEAYASAVAEYEPEVAEQWAMTLAEGPERQATLRAVLENWPASDPDGAAAFALRHGMEGGNGPEAPADPGD